MIVRVARKSFMKRMEGEVMTTRELLENQLADSEVPPHIHGAIVRYIVDGTPPGGFLTAVICNDLRESFARADLDNREQLFEIVNFFYNHAPGKCWGSPDEMMTWEGMTGG